MLLLSEPFALKIKNIQQQPMVTSVCRCPLISSQEYSLQKEICETRELHHSAKKLKTDDDKEGGLKHVFANLNTSVHSGSFDCMLLGKKALMSVDPQSTLGSSTSSTSPSGFNIYGSRALSTRTAELENPPADVKRQQQQEFGNTEATFGII